MPYLPKRPPLDPCPVEEVLALVGGKWKSRLMLLVSGPPQRFTDLRRALPGISNHVLKTQLAALERDSLVVSLVRHGGTDRRGYRLTAEGRSLMTVLDQVARWGEQRLETRLNLSPPIEPAQPSQAGAADPTPHPPAAPA